MSTWFTSELTCVRCSMRFAARTARSVNVGHSPELRDLALCGELNQPRCTACDAVIPLDQPLVYSDPERGQWVVVAELADLGRWREAESIALGGLRSAIDTNLGTGSTERLRIVFDIDELREKLAIWDADLDDGVVECIKLACIRARPEIHRRGDRIRVLAFPDPDTVLLGVAPAARPRHVHTQWSTSRTLEDAATYRDRFPELFAPGFVSIDRYLR